MNQEMFLRRVRIEVVIPVHTWTLVTLPPYLGPAA
jgi:hypothetical protein